MKTLLSQLQYDLLLNHLPANVKEILLYSRKLPIGNDRKIHIEMKDSERDIVIDCLTNILINEGLDNNDEPNKIGCEIERLIDAFQAYE